MTLFTKIITTVAVSACFIQPAHAFLGFGKYKSKSEASSACRQWAEKGGSYTQRYREEARFIFPDRDTWHRHHPGLEDPRKGKKKWGTRISRELYLDPYYGAKARASREHDNSKLKVWKKQTVEIRRCILESETKQYLGWEVKAINGQVIEGDWPSEAVKKYFKF